MEILPSATWQMLEQRMSDKPLPRGLDAAWDTGVGLIGQLLPRRKTFLRRAERVLALEKQFSQMTDAKLHKIADELREIFRRGRDNYSDLERAFALIREIAGRQIGDRPFPVQIAGAFALESGCVAEMATGEGKTLTATMPATVAGWRGQGCHVITVNDYLAQRDAEWMGRIYRFCGLSVAHIEQAMPPAERRAAYSADITYCTNKEVTADFLRDRLVLGHLGGLSSALLSKIARTGQPVIDRLVQRGLNFAIVDEADSILVDEAITPLIISGPAPNPEQIEAFRQAADVANNLKSETDYRVNPRYREVELTNTGRARLEEVTSTLGDIWQGARRREEITTKALIAKELYSLDKQYVIDDGKVVIVDDFTGRLMWDRSWRDGLHQAVEAKEKLEITPPKDTYARISFQRFFRLYRKLSGMTGTASEATAEFWQIYHLPIVVIPTNRPCVRKNLPDIVLPTESAKWKRIAIEIHRVHQTTRPILVGTRSVRASEYLSQLLKAENLDHQVLNAVYHRQEAQIVAGAGQAGRITVATNMAGRGTDIKLGRGVAQLGGLHVIASERNESGRIDRQLFGRCARQGDPGSTQAIVCLEDEFVSRYTRNPVAYLRKRYAHTTDDISSTLIRGIFRLAQLRAEKLALRQRKSVMRTDHWLEEQLSFTGRE
ncbi:MAG: preprotein translocase subunit SecA [Planctomycetota bacterium]|jgi:preprotein translocase subunit SecA